MTTRRHFVQSAASLAAFGAFPLAAFAQAFDAVKIINGFPAGGTADVHPLPYAITRSVG